MVKADLVIIGAGPGGCMTAMSAAAQGVDVLLLDKANFPRDKICGDALSGKVAEVLRRNDPKFLDELDSGNAFLDSWGVDFYAPSGERLKVPFKKDYDTSDRAPGFIAKRLDFDNQLLQRTLTHSGIHFHPETEIRSFEQSINGYILKPKAGEEIEAKLVVAADGAYSGFARSEANLKAEGKELCYGLRAYFSGVKELDADGFIELHFLKEALPGYFWIFPLPNGLANVGVGMRADKMKEKGIKLKPLFEELIANHPRLKDRFADAQMDGGVRLFDLPLGNRRRDISGKSFMLVGDSAALIDPFTGEGIGNAMISGEFAGKHAAEALQAGDFSARFMKKYDHQVYDRLWEELKISSRLQQLVNYPWLFNFVVRKANRNATLQETISCMFEDIDLRGRLKDPRFYAKILFQ